MKHPKTNIGVHTRYQFTPVQIAKHLNDIGFKILDISPIHVHGMTPAFKLKYPKVHTSVSNLIHEYSKGELSLLPMASSFMVHCKKG